MFIIRSRGPYTVTVAAIWARSGWDRILNLIYPIVEINAFRVFDKAAFESGF